MNKLLHRFRLLVAILALLGCAGSEQAKPPQGSTSEPPAGLKVYLTGRAEDVVRPTTFGLMLQGGGRDNDDAIRWLIARAGGGDAVVLRVDDSDGYNPYFYASLGGLNSVRTLVVNSRELADSTYVETVVKQAEMLFIAGGDQTQYATLWKGTRLASAMEYLMTVKKVPVGGTSAGMAVLGGIDYLPQGLAVISAEALADPYHRNMASLAVDFLVPPFMAGLVTDTHWSERNRCGRTVAFLARAIQDGLGTVASVQAIAADQDAALVIDAQGRARIFGSSAKDDYVFFLKPRKDPERCQPGQPLHWPEGVGVYQVRGHEDGRNTFDIAIWEGTGGVWLTLGVNQGNLSTDPQTPR